MKHATLLAFAAILLAACDSAPTAAARDDLGRPNFRAFTFTENTKVPLELLVFVPCANGGAGEDVALSGNLHLLSHITESNSGNGRLILHSQSAGINGIGLVTGDKYRATGATRESRSFFRLPDTFTLVNNFRIIGPGPSNNFLVHETFHITINANGKLTTFVDNLRIQCK